MAIKSQTLNYPGTSGGRVVRMPLESGVLGNDEVRFIAGNRLGKPEGWQLLSARFSLTTDATVADRYIRLFICRADGSYSDTQFQSAAIAASLTRTFVVGALRYVSSGGVNDNAVVGVEPRQMYFEGDDYLKVAVGSGVVGDALTGVLTWLYLPAGYIPG